MWSGDDVLQKLKQFADIFLQIFTAETIKIQKFRTIHLLILNQYVCFTVGANGPIGVKPPSPCVASLLTVCHCMSINC